MPATGAFFDFFQGHFEAAPAGRYLKENLTVFDVRGGLTVGYQDDLLIGAAVFFHQLPGQDQSVLHIGMGRKVFPADIGQLFRSHAPGDIVEAQNIQAVFGEFAADQGIERDGDNFGRFKIAVHAH